MSYLSDKINQGADSIVQPNSGTLVAAPGTRLADLRRESTLDIGQGSGSLNKESKQRFFIQSKRFDWQLPNSQLLFENCSSYAITTDEAGETVVDMQIGTAERYYTWAEVKEQMYEIEQRLLADGWRPERNKLGVSSSDKLHKQLENPDFKQFDDEIAAASYGKGNLAVSFYAKRARNQGKPDIAEGQNFLHYVIIDLDSLELVQQN